MFIYVYYKYREKMNIKVYVCIRLKLIDISKVFFLYKNIDYIGFSWDILMRKVLVVCLERVFLFLSTMVSDINTG